MVGKSNCWRYIFKKTFLSGFSIIFVHLQYWELSLAMKDISGWDLNLCPLEISVDASCYQASSRHRSWEPPQMTHPQEGGHNADT